MGRSSEDWDRIRVLAGELNLPLEFATRRAGIRPVVGHKYISGEKVPETKTCSRVLKYLQKVRHKRLELFGYI